MPIAKLAHYSVRASDLDASERFYVEAMGFRVGGRPAFPFPGRWLYLGDDEVDCGVVHLIGTAGDESGLADYLGERPEGGQGDTGVLDHIAFLATGWRDMRERLRCMRIDHVERIVPELGLLQIFLRDPSGVVVELNYPATEA